MFDHHIANLHPKHVMNNGLNIIGHKKLSVNNDWYINDTVVRDVRF